MAAYLDLILRRRHALPAHLMAGLGRGRDRPAASRPASGLDGRPRLLAAWHLDAGRCQAWLTRAVQNEGEARP